MEKPKRPRGRPTAESKAAYEAELKKYEETVTQAFVEKKLAEPHQRRKSSLTPNDETLKTIFEFAKLNCPQAEIAALLHVSEHTLISFMKTHPVAREAWEDGKQYHKVILRNDQVELSKKNAVMGIFRGKNTLGQKDESHNTTTITTTAAEMSHAELMEIALGGAKAPASPKPTKH